MFFTSAAGNPVAADELKSLPTGAKAKLVAHLDDLCGPDPTVVPKKVAKDIFEVKTRIDRLAPRALIGYERDDVGQIVVVLVCILKKSTKLEQKDLDLAKDRFAKFRSTRKA
ncbi:MAG: type II toxin-antitoxin system RelE/ParE family toxin [Acidimicrobiales bacterium]